MSTHQLIERVKIAQAEDHASDRATYVATIRRAASGDPAFEDARTVAAILKAQSKTMPEFIRDVGLLKAYVEAERAFNLLPDPADVQREVNAAHEFAKAKHGAMVAAQKEYLDAKSAFEGKAFANDIRHMAQRALSEAQRNCAGLLN